MTSCAAKYHYTLFVVNITHANMLICARWLSGDCRIISWNVDINNFDIIQVKSIWVVRSVKILILGKSWGINACKFFILSILEANIILMACQESMSSGMVNFKKCWIWQNVIFRLSWIRYCADSPWWLLSTELGRKDQDKILFLKNDHFLLRNKRTFPCQIHAFDARQLQDPNFHVLSILSTPLNHPPSISTNFVIQSIPKNKIPSEFTIKEFPR